MADQYSITTEQLVAIGCKQIGKAIPFIGQIIDAHEKVFETVEMNRVQALLSEMTKRLDVLEKQDGKATVFDEKAAGVLLYGADQIRHDVLAESKAKEYGAAVAHYVRKPDDLNEVFEVLDCLRKLSASDLKVLYQFWIGHEIFDNRAVADLAGYQRGVNPMANTRDLARQMEAIFPTLMRLQGLGVIYLAHARGGGEIMPDIGGLRDEFQKFAFLTDGGKRLVRVLPR